MGKQKDQSGEKNKLLPHVNPYKKTHRKLNTVLYSLH